MLLAIVVVYLFGLGALIVLGAWRILRRLDALTLRAVRLARPLRRTTRRIARMERTLGELVRLARHERALADRTRTKLVEFIDGPVSQRRPALPGMRAGAHADAPSGSDCLD